MLQSKLGSFYEAAMNIIIGFVVAICSQLIVFPLFNIDITFSDNLMIGFYFTIISLCRSYVIRRWFNARLRAAAEKLAATTRDNT